MFGGLHEGDHRVRTEELYWQFLLAAAVALCAAICFVRRRVELWCAASGAALALLVLFTRT